MDENGNVRNSTLVIGVVGVLVLIVLGTWVAGLVAPRFRFLTNLPAVAFAAVYIEVHRRRAARDARERGQRPADDN